MFKIEGEQAKAIAAVEAEMEAFNKSAEQQYTMFEDKIKGIMYSVAGITPEEGDNRMWNLISKFYPKFGFYMAEMEDYNLSLAAPDLREEPTNNTRH